MLKKALLAARADNDSICDLIYENETLSQEDFSDIQFSSVQFMHCRFERCRFIRADFSLCKFDGCDFSGCDFSESYWQNVVLYGCKGSGTNFKESRIKSCTFTDCVIPFANFSYSRWEKLYASRLQLHRKLFLTFPPKRFSGRKDDILPHRLFSDAFKQRRSFKLQY